MNKEIDNNIHFDPTATIPMSVEELRARGVTRPDFVLVTGDALIDHPSFGTAIIARVLMAHGYSVGVIAQPDWRDVSAFRALGRPKLAFLVNSGNMDSMVNHYTAAKKPRSEDAYSEGGEAGKRPDRAVIVYVNRCREAFRRIPVVIGGIEASLRRFAHYDYWDDKVRRSILVDSGADLLIYGMGERQIVDMADALASGLPIDQVTYVAGTCFYTDSLDKVYDYKLIESFEEVSLDKAKYASAFMAQYREQDAVRGARLVQPHGKGFLVANPPAMPLTRRELDEVYDLPYTRKPHPNYKKTIPALEEVEFSLTSCRGCFGGCSFCALTFHQGRVVQSRSRESLVEEAKLMAKLPDFKGNIHDVGGPTADFRVPACKKQLEHGVCADRQCLGFKPCPNLEADHADYVGLLAEISAVPGVKRVFVRSGVRYDYVMYDKSDAFLKALVRSHVSGRLKVAPEHVNERVLRLMGKPPRDLYDAFCRKYERFSAAEGKEQFIVPYFMSSHPGSDLNAAVELALYLKRTGQRPEQVQDFYPTPGTLSTCMYYTGADPRTGEKVYVPRSQKEKAMQRALMQFFKSAYAPLAREALKAAGREDLIGFGKDALLPPREMKHAPKHAGNGHETFKKRAAKTPKKRRNS
ncbi:MAG TPA: YgiQ family radical SAM protein [Clostridia bacterium]|nr:YgiQ family radical SAM protein [Clostridia bacterium]